MVRPPGLASRSIWTSPLPYDVARAWVVFKICPVDLIEATGIAPVKREVTSCNSANSPCWNRTALLA